MAASRRRRIEAEFSIKLKRDGTLEAMPAATDDAGQSVPASIQESALRAIIECQPYKLPAAFFDEWKYFEPVFDQSKAV